MKRRHALLPVILAVGAACVSTSRRMELLEQPMAGPPRGRALVVVYQPKFHTGWGTRYLPLWDGRTFMGEISSGEALYHVCKPGRHHFVGYNWAGSTVIEGDLHAGGVYAIRMDVNKIRPMDEDDRAKIPEWNRTLEPLVSKRDANVTEYEALHADKIAALIEDFTTGAKRDRLMRLR